MEFTFENQGRVNSYAANTDASPEWSEVNAELESLRVLLIEDNDGDYRLTREMVREIGLSGEPAGAHIELVRVGRLSEALAFLETHSVRLILLDFYLPDAEGLEGLHRLHAAVPGIPVILLTGASDLRTARQALAEGAQDYLVKGQIDSGLLLKSIIYAVERKRVEKEREEMQERLLRAQKLESLGLMAGGLAHDLNNLLQGIVSYTNLASRRLEKGMPASEQLQQIERLVVHASELVDKLFACAGPRATVTEQIFLSELVADAVNLMSPTLPESVSIEFTQESSLSAIAVDPAQIRQVVLNLLSNAVEAVTAVGGVIRVKISDQIIPIGKGQIEKEERTVDELPAGRYLVLEVSDSGCGMDEATRQKVFEPFFTTKKFGRGLGLASVLGIIRGYAGNISVKSSPETGTRFRVWLPTSSPSLHA